MQVKGSIPPPLHTTSVDMSDHPKLGLYSHHQDSLTRVAFSALVMH